MNLFWDFVLWRKDARTDKRADGKTNKAKFNGHFCIQIHYRISKQGKQNDVTFWNLIKPITSYPTWRDMPNDIIPEAEKTEEITNN